MSDCVRTTWSPAEALSGIFKAWAARDKQTTLAFLAADAVYRIYIPADVVPFGGETKGKASISDRLQTVLDLFDTIRYEGVLNSATADSAQGVASFCFRHKLTGEEIDGTLRLVIRVRDGVVVEIDEYHDLEKIRAFMRLVAYSAAGG